jgi:pimeloyl-ACP methyl ester carboxylesterase
MKRISIGDGELNVEERGSGAPLLLVHGFPLDHTMWRSQIEALSAGHRVIAPDLRGFGSSSPSGDVLSMESHADDLAKLLDALGVDRPIVLCGLSMGGYIAWQFAARHGERLAKLIQCDTRSAADTEEAATGRRALAERVLKEGAGIVADAMLPKLFAEQTARTNPTVVDGTRRVILATAPATIAAALRGMAQRPDMTPKLAEIRVPALLICGQHDAITPAEEMRRVAAAIPAADFVEIQAAGHMAPLEDPLAVNAAIQPFLAR